MHLPDHPRATSHDIVTVADAQLVEAMRFFAERMKIVVEPTGCLGAAAALNGTVPIAGQRVGIIISGGNVDPTALAGYWLEPTCLHEGHRSSALTIPARCVYKPAHMRAARLRGLVGLTGFNDPFLPADSRGPARLAGRLSTRGRDAWPTPGRPRR